MEDFSESLVKKNTQVVHLCIFLITPLLISLEEIQQHFRREDVTGHRKDFMIYFI